MADALRRRVHLPGFASEWAGCHFKWDGIGNRCMTPHHWATQYQPRQKPSFTEMARRSVRRKKITDLSWRNWKRRPKSEWPNWVKLDAALKSFYSNNHMGSVESSLNAAD